MLPKHFLISLHPCEYKDSFFFFPISTYQPFCLCLSTATKITVVCVQVSNISSEITYRPMMGEFIIYYRGKIVGGMYDDRLLVKPVKSAISYMPTAPYELPYEGAKEMLLVDEVDNKEFLAGLFNAMYDELPNSKPKKKK